MKCRDENMWTVQTAEGEKNRLVAKHIAQFLAARKKPMSQVFLHLARLNICLISPEPGQSLLVPPRDDPHCVLPLVDRHLLPVRYPLQTSVFLSHPRL